VLVVSVYTLLDIYLYSVVVVKRYFVGNMTNCVMFSPASPHMNGVGGYP